jgi:MFS family permease
MALSFVLFGLAQALWMLYAARVLGGLLSSAVLPTAMAYIADSTSTEQRGRSMGLLGAAMGLGMIFGPAIGGFLGDLAPSIPFFVAAGLTVAVAGFTAVALPESLSETVRAQARAAGNARTSAHGQLLHALRGPTGLLLVLGFLSQFALASLFGTFALFAEAKLGFGEGEMGALFTAMGLVGALGQGLLVGRAIHLFGEARVVQIGLLMSGVGFWSMLLAYDLPSLMAFIGILGLGSSLLGPALTSLLSKRTRPEQQGAVMGVFNSYQSLGRILGPIVGGVFFDALGYASPYVFGGALFLGSSAMLRPSSAPTLEAGE